MENTKKITSGYNIEDLLGRKPVVLHNENILLQLRGKVVLITGAAGSIGSELVRQVVTFSPKSIIMLDQAETPLYLLSREMEEKFPEVTFHSELCDIVNKKILNKVFERHHPEIVYHAAAYKHVPLLETNPAQAVLVNVLGTKNVADCSLKHKAETFVLISTDKAVNPSSVMGASKLIAERYVQALYSKTKPGLNAVATKYITTRFGNVLGSNGSVVPIFEKQIQSGGPVTLTHPEMKRYFMTITEACQLVLEAGAMGQGGEIYIFGMGEPVSIATLAEKMVALAGLIPGRDIHIKVTGLRPGEKLNEELVTDKATIIKTDNPAIMVAQEEHFEFDEVLKSIKIMVAYAEEYDFNGTIAEIQRFLPEFGSLKTATG